MAVNDPNELNNKDLQQQQDYHDSMSDDAAALKQHSNAVLENARKTRELGGAINTVVDHFDDLSDTAANIDRALHLLPDKLHSITETMNKNMAYISGDLKDSFLKGIMNEKLYAVRAELGRETEELRLAVDAAKDAVKTAKESNDQSIIDYAQRKLEQTEMAYNERKNMTDSQKLNKKLAYDMKTELVKIGKQMFSDIWKYAQQILDQAYTKDKSTIEQSYGTVMSYNSYSQGEYAKLIDRLQEKIEQSGLGDVVSINTLQENLVKTLQTGLQGALAESNAYYASIAEKAGITFDWYSSDWTTLMSQMERQGRDYEGLMKSMITITDDLAETYGDSKGLAEGRANQMMAAAASWGSTYGLDEAQVSNIYKSLAVTSQELTSYGIDTTNLVTDITEAMQSGLTTQQAGIIFGTGGASGQEVEAKIKAGKFDELIVQYMSNIENLYKGNGDNNELVSALQSALGGSFSLNDYAALDTYWSENGSFAKNFKEGFNSVTTTFEGVTDELENYVTEQESYETRMENYLADIAEVMVQNPILDVISRTLQSGLASIISMLTSYLMMKSLMGGSGGSSGGTLANSLSALWNGQSTQVLREGVKQSSKNANYFTLNGKRISSADAYTTTTTGGIKNFLNTPKGANLLGGGMIAAGVAMGLSDSYDAGKSAAANWDSYSTTDKWLAAGNTGLAFLTGHNANSTNAEKMQKAKEGKSFNWGSLAKNAGKGALVGGGIGGIAGGGAFSWAGAGIGALIGGAAGAIANATQQLIDMKDYKDFVNSDLGKLSSTIDEASKANDKFLSSLTNYQNKLNELTSTQDTLNKAKSGELDMSDRELRITEMKVEALKAELALELQKLGNASDLVNNNDSYVKTINEKGAGLSAYRSVKSAALAAGLSEDTDWSTKSDEQLRAIISDEELQAMVSSGLIKHTGSDRTTRLGIIQTIVGTSTSNFIGTDYDSKVETDFFSHASVQDGTLESTWDADIKKAYNELTKVGTTGSSILSYADSTTAIKAIHNAMTAVLSSAYNELRMSYPGESEAQLQERFIKAQGSLSEVFSDLAPSFPAGRIGEYQAYLKDNAVGTGKLAAYYATGTEFVPYDNYLALLHRGEQVRTAAEVAVERANEHVASTDVSSKINDTLLTQTNTIINILTNIYTVLSRASSSGAIKLSNMTYDLPGI